MCGSHHSVDPPGLSADGGGLPVSGGGKALCSPQVWLDERHKFHLLISSRNSASKFPLFRVIVAHTEVHFITVSVNSPLRITSVQFGLCLNFFHARQEFRVLRATYNILSCPLGKINYKSKLYK